jgi:hypothetical protein
MHSLIRSRMSFIASFLDSLYPKTATRRGTFACPCGAVQLELIVPPSSHFIEQTSAICHCHDCVDFCKACQNADLLINNNATNMIQFYKSDVTVIKGRDKIGTVKLRKDSFLIRCYCKECGTALGAETSPIVLLYLQFISGDDSTMPVYLPNVVLNYASSPASGTRPYDKRTTVRRGLLAPLFLLRALTRVLLGLLFGKNTGGLLQHYHDTSNIPVGLESIPQKSQ